MRLIIVLSALAVLAGCQTTPEDQQASAAGVEERKPGAKPGVQSKPVPGSQVGKVDPTKPGAGKSPAAAGLKDPSSPLSRRQIFFDYDKFEVKDEYRPVIEAHAKYLRENANAKMLVQGNADERGSREYNVALGQRRSDNVKKMLVLLGAREAQVESVSLGEEKPMCADHNEQCWAKNRRGDMLYGGEY